MLAKFKGKIQSLLTLAAKATHKMGLTPNMVSVIGLCLILLSAFAYSMRELLFAAILLFFAGFCDVLDGIVARLYEEMTEFGAFLDSLMDRYGDAIVLAGMTIGGLCHVESGLAAIIGSLLVSYTRARAETIGIKMESIGLAERAERLLILLVSSITAIFWPPALELGVILVALLTNFTVLQRTLYVYRTLKRSRVNGR
jgi:archaetidylinositol phosphate synthase